MSAHAGEEPLLDSEPVDPVSRRRFLGLLGASAALAAGCSRIDRGAIVPAARDVPESAPGVTSYYASTFAEGLGATGVVVKTREGRPIHVQGNDLDPLSRGKAPLRAIADVLRLYDPDRLRQPRVDGAPASWDAALGRLTRGLAEARDAGRPVVLLTGAVVSPTRRALIGEVSRALPALVHLQWEPAVSDEQQAAQLSCFGAAGRARFRFDRARVLLCVEADPLGGAAPGEVAAFSAWRRPSTPSDAMNRLWVLEGGLSLTGAKADHRLALPPSLAARVLFALARRLHEGGLPLPAGVPREALALFDGVAVARESGLPPDEIEALAGDLLVSSGAALVLVGPALPAAAHVAGHVLSAMLSAEGHTLETDAAPSLATLREMRALFERMAAGEVGGAILWGVNPAYAFPDETLVRAALEKVPVRAAIALCEDETTALCPVVLPEHHWLESWGDSDASSGLLRLQQPALRPLYDTRPGEEVLLSVVRALGAPVPADHLDYLKDRWRLEVHAGAFPVPFERFWEAAVHDGLLERPVVAQPARALRPEAVMAAAREAARGETDGLDLLLTLGPLHDGRYANNGWLQELPDPVTKLTWGNVVSVGPNDARRLGVTDGDVVRLEVGGKAVTAPLVVQPGQAAGVVTLALGHGRQAGAVATGVGVNAFRLLDGSGGPSLRRGAAITRTGRTVALPTTQQHSRMEGRDIVRSYTRAEHGAGLATPEREPASFNPPPRPGPHKWGMVIDLSACVGCSACVVACQSENNVPVVGPEQVGRGRQMHWMRIDRYYEGDAERPRVLLQPMLCQQCDDAPCETVCPVNATTHSAEGLNQMTYNRCVGTRYCANNCPYKVRRFNFLDFTGMKKEPETLVFNPEVTVRPRGVMEKCTFCVQRIEEARAEASVEKRPIRDGEVRLACEVACPAEAIVFGDLHDPGSRVSRLAHSPRGYKLLAHLGVRPVVVYLAEVRNPAGDTHVG